MNVSRPDLATRSFGTPFQIPTLRNRPVYCYYAVRISCPGAASGSVALLVDDVNPPLDASAFGTAALNNAAADEEDITLELSGIVGPGQWVELRSATASGAPVIELLSAVEVEV